MTLHLLHLTSSPCSGRSLATFWGRNDALSSLVLRRQGLVGEIAVLGGGVCEPIAIAASRELGPNGRVVAFDSAPAVHAALGAILDGPAAAKETLGSRVWARPTPEERESLEAAGIESGALAVQGGALHLAPRVRARLTSVQCDLLEAIAHWRQERTTWDLIVCNNVLSGISVRLGADAVPEILAQLPPQLNPSGSVILGVLDSQLYASDRHPPRVAHFSAEVARALKDHPLRIDGWFARAWVRENLPFGVLVDGYTQLVLRHRGAAPLFSDLAAPTPHCPQLRAEPRMIREGDLLGGRSAYIFSALHVGNGRYAASLGTGSFPDSVVEHLAVGQSDLSFQLCEGMLAREVS